MKKILIVVAAVLFALLAIVAMSNMEAFMDGIQSGFEDATNAEVAK